MIDDSLRQAHKANKGLSILTDVQFKPDGSSVVALARVLADKGEYSYWSFKPIEGVGEEEAAAAAQDAAVRGALLYAAREAGEAHSDIFPSIERPVVRLAAESAQPNLAPCEGPGDAHLIGDYWSGTAYLSPEQVAELNLQRHGKRLCVSCALALIPKRRGARAH